MRTNKKLKAIIIDHNDSFTENVRAWLQPDFEVTVIHFDNIPNVQTANHDLIIISPGPKSPQDYPRTIHFLKSLPNSQPVLGICLGMQMMYHLTGAHIKSYAPPIHGKATKMICEIPDFHQTSIARYHSLRVPDIHSEFNVLGTSDGIPMWAQHPTKKWMGFQFHPESFLTEKSVEFKNFIKGWICE